FGADLRARGTFAQEAGIAAAAERELQRIDEDRLARAGLAGEHGEAPIEIDLELGHDHDVAQRQPPQHARPFSRGPRASGACASTSRSSSTRTDAGSARRAASGTP